MLENYDKSEYIAIYFFIYNLFAIFFVVPLIFGVIYGHYQDFAKQKKENSKGLNKQGKKNAFECLVRAHASKNSPNTSVDNSLTAEQDTQLICFAEFKQVCVKFKLYESYSQSLVRQFCNFVISTRQKIAKKEYKNEVIAQKHKDEIIQQNYEELVKINLQTDPDKGMNFMQFQPLCYHIYSLLVL